MKVTPSASSTIVTREPTAVVIAKRQRHHARHHRLRHRVCEWLSIEKCS